MILWTILRPICKSKWSDAFLPSGERKQKEGEGGQEKVRERPKPHIIKRSEAADMRWDIKPCQELLYPQCKQHFARQLLFFTILPPHPYTTSKSNLPASSTSIPFLSIHWENDFFLLSTSFQANTTLPSLPQTSPCPLSPPSNICTNPTWFWHSYLMFLIILQCISVCWSRFP